MSKNFVTIFPICENVHLTKDLGQIPYFMHKKYGYSSKIVCYKNSDSYNNLEGEVKGLEIDFIKNTGRISFLEKSVLKYIFKNAKKIDVLNLYIFSKYTFVYGILYKWRNPSGFLFLKLDGYNETFAEGVKVVHSVKPVKNLILKYFERLFLKKIDLVSIENTEGEDLVQRKYPTIKNKVTYLPVGVNDIYIEQIFGNGLKKFEEKENIILTTGRIGEEIKNHKMILRALSRMDMKDWKMVFVGPINSDFADYYNTFLKDFPSMKEKIVFTGNITDRKELYGWYNRSKIFCMTSYKESFCHAIVEALYFGNYIIGTEGIMSMKDITDNGKYGLALKLDDDEALGKALQKLIDDQTQLKQLYPEIVSFSRRKFVWSQIIDKIFKCVEPKTKK